MLGFIPNRVALGSGAGIVNLTDTGIGFRKCNLGRRKKVTGAFVVTVNLRDVLDMQRGAGAKINFIGHGVISFPACGYDCASGYIITAKVRKEKYFKITGCIINWVYEPQTAYLSFGDDHARRAILVPLRIGALIY